MAMKKAKEPVKVKETKRTTKKPPAPPEPPPEPPAPKDKVIDIDTAAIIDASETVMFNNAPTVTYPGSHSTPEPTVFAELIVTIDPEQKLKLETYKSDLITKAEAISITDEQSNLSASQFLSGTVKKFEKDIEETFRPGLKSVGEVEQLIRKEMKSYSLVQESAEKLTKRKMSDWIDEKERREKVERERVEAIRIAEASKQEAIRRELEDDKQRTSDEVQELATNWLMANPEATEDQVTYQLRRIENAQVRENGNPVTSILEPEPETLYTPPVVTTSHVPTPGVSAPKIVKWRLTSFEDLVLSVAADLMEAPEKRRGLIACLSLNEPGLNALGRITKEKTVLGGVEYYLENSIRSRVT